MDGIVDSASRHTVTDGAHFADLALQCISQTPIRQEAAAEDNAIALELTGISILLNADNPFIGDFLGNQAQVDLNVVSFQFFA